MPAKATAAQQTCHAWPVEKYSRLYPEPGAQADSVSGWVFLADKPIKAVIMEPAAGAAMSATLHTSVTVEREVQLEKHDLSARSQQASAITVLQKDLVVYFRYQAENSTLRRFQLKFASIRDHQSFVAVLSRYITVRAPPGPSSHPTSVTSSQVDVMGSASQSFSQLPSAVAPSVDFPTSARLPVSVPVQSRTPVSAIAVANAIAQKRHGTFRASGADPESIDMPGGSPTAAPSIHVHGSLPSCPQVQPRFSSTQELPTQVFSSQSSPQSYPQTPSRIQELSDQRDMAAPIEPDEGLDDTLTTLSKDRNSVVLKYLSDTGLHKLLRKVMRSRDFEALMRKTDFDGLRKEMDVYYRGVERERKRAIAGEAESASS